MLIRNLGRIGSGIVLVLLVAALSYGQYGGGGMTGGTSGSGTYTAPKGGYSSATGIGIGAAAAGGVAIAYLLVRSHRRMQGCVERPNGATTLVDEKDKKSYALESGSLALRTGDRVELSGRKLKDSAGQPAFAAKKLVKDFGPCRQEAALHRPTVK